MWPFNGAGDEESSGNDGEEGDKEEAALGCDLQHAGGMASEAAP